MNRTVHTLAALAALLLSSHAFALVTATLDRDEIAPGETVELTLERDSQGGGDPDFGPLEKDFDVMGTSTGRSVQFVNGKISARVQVQVTLSPKHTGIITIPALRWNNEQSAPLQLRVNDDGSTGGGRHPAAAPGAAPHVFLTAELDEPRPYVLAPAILTVQLHTDVPVYQATLELPANPDVVVQPLGKDRQFTERRDGRALQVVERRFMLFPQKSGALSLEGPVLDAQVAQPDNDLFGGDPIFGKTFGQMLQRSRPLRLHGNPIALDVQPRPPEWTGADWLPARNVTLEETWQPADGEVRAGEPLTRHLVLKVEGQAATQLPDLGASMPLPDG
ncbi:MAG TPA: BatD family protein, partial [Nevskiaceae bacterium]|nr:BatD family protein [Nevskiaceae bacterium]